MTIPEVPDTSDELGFRAAAAMAEIRAVLSRLTPGERVAFWHAVDLTYRAPFGSPMSLQECRPIQNGVAQALRTMLPPSERERQESGKSAAREPSA